MKMKDEELDRLADRIFKASGPQMVAAANKKILKSLLIVISVAALLWITFLFFNHSLNIATISEASILLVGVVALVMLAFTNDIFGKFTRKSMANIVLKKVSRDISIKNMDGIISIKDDGHLKIYRDMNNDELIIFHMAVAVGIVKASDLFSYNTLDALIDASSAADVQKTLTRCDIHIDINHLAKTLSNISDSK